MSMQPAPLSRAPGPDFLQAQVVVLLLELRGLLKHVWNGGATEGDAFTELRTRAYGAITGYVRRAEAPFRLGFALPEVLLGGALLRGTRAAYEAAYELGRQLEELGGTELTIGVDLGPDDFAAVIEAIAKARRDVVEFSSPSPAFVLRPSRDAQDLDDPESPEHVAHAYAASVVAMRHLFEDLAGTSVLPPRAKRIGHGLVDLSAVRLPLLVAAASAPAAATEPAGRAVSAAIFSLALLRQLTDDRRLLSHVAMAALLCEVGHTVAAPESPATTDAEPEGARAALTVASLMALGRLNEASVVRTVVAFETQWIEASKSPVYAGRRRTTLAARTLRVVRRYQTLIGTLPESSTPARVDVLYTQCEDEIEQLLVCAFAAALQIPQPEAALDPVEEGTADAAALLRHDDEAAPVSESGRSVPSQRVTAESPALRPEELPAGLDDETEVPGEASPAESSPVESLPAESSPAEPLPAEPLPEDSPPPGSVLEVVDSGWSVFPPSTHEPVEPEAPELASSLPTAPPREHVESAARIPSLPPPPSLPVLDPEPELAAPLSEALPTPRPEAIAPLEPAAVPTAPPPAPASELDLPTPPPPAPSSLAPLTAALGDVPDLSQHESAPTPSAVQAAARRIPTAQGNLGTQPVPHVLLYALDQSLTGTLVFEEPRTFAGAEGPSHRVFLLDGAPAQAHLQLRVSRLGEVLARLGLVSASLVETLVQQSMQLPRASRMLLGELLLSRSVLSKEDLSRALEAQLVERLAALATLPSGTTYSFYADENLFGDEPGASELLTTSPLNALFATLRGSVDEERMMATLKRIWRIPLAFHPDADREAYALTGEEEAVLERIEHGRLTIDELLADRRVSRAAAIQLVYFLAVTRQLSWKGQKKGPIMPRGSRPKTGFSPPLPPRIAPLPDDGRVLSATQHTKPRIRVRILTPGGSRMIESGMPTPAMMQAVRLEEEPSPNTIPSPADSGYDIDVSVGEPEAPSGPPTPLPSRLLLDLPSPGESTFVDPGAALVALVTALRLEADGDRAGAAEAMLRASRLDPDEPEYAARLCRLSGGRSDATQRLDRLHVEHPNHLSVTLEWARQNLQSTHLQSALDGYSAVLARDITHAEAARCVVRIREELDERTPA